MRGWGMIDLSEMAEFMDNAAAQGTPGLVATAGKDGAPNLAYKGSIMVWDKDHLAFWERAKGETLTDLEENPQIAALYRNRELGKMWRFWGVAELLTSGELRDQIMAKTIQAELTVTPSGPGRRPDPGRSRVGRRHRTRPATTTRPSLLSVWEGGWGRSRALTKPLRVSRPLPTIPSPRAAATESAATARGASARGHASAAPARTAAASARGPGSSSRRRATSRRPRRAPTPAQALGADPEGPDGRLAPLNCRAAASVAWSYQDRTPAPGFPGQLPAYFLVDRRWPALAPTASRYAVNTEKSRSCSTLRRDVPARKTADMIGAVIAFRLLARALSAIISRLTSPHREWSVGAVRMVTLLIVVGIVASLVQGDDAAAQSPTPASPTPLKATATPRPSRSSDVRAQAVGGFVSGTVWDDSKIRNGQFDDNEPGIAGVTMIVERVDVASGPITCTTGTGTNINPTDSNGKYRCEGLAVACIASPSPSRRSTRRRRRASARSASRHRRRHRELRAGATSIRASASIGGVVFLDCNENGIQDLARRVRQAPTERRLRGHAGAHRRQQPPHVHSTRNAATASTTSILAPTSSRSGSATPTSRRPRPPGVRSRSATRSAPSSTSVSWTLAATRSA